MTLQLDRAEHDTATAATPAPLRALWQVLPWILPFAAFAFGLHHTATPARDIAVYGAYLAIAVVVPGTLVHRWLRGSRGNLPEDLGLGAATGLLVMLLGWALCAATRQQELLPFWPLLIIVLFVAVPALRRHWRIPAEARKPLPLAWSWIIAVALLAVVVFNYHDWVLNPLPPHDAFYYPDLLYHLALVHEMTRSIPFQVPQVAGDTLRYHYLSDADMAISSMITRIPATTILLRFWLVPIVGITMFVAASLTRTVTGKWWAGALGGAVAVISLPLGLGAAQGTPGTVVIFLNSPSQAYALPLLGLLLLLATDALSGRPLGKAWVLVFPLALACAGAKSSTLPPFVAGLVVAAAVVLFTHRDRLRASIVFCGLTFAAMLVGLKIFAGGGAGTLKLQPFAMLYWIAPYKQTLGIDDKIDGSRFLPLGVDRAGLGGWLFLAALFCWWFVYQTPRLLGLTLLVEKRTRTDPAAWLLGGLTAAGAAAMWLFWHPSGSQFYFYLTAAPFAALFAVWLLAHHTTSWRPVVAGLVAGGVWQVFAPKVGVPHHKTILAWSWVLLKPVLTTAVVAIVVAAVALVVWRLVSGRTAWRGVLVGSMAAIVGAGLMVGLFNGTKSTLTIVRQTPKAPYQAVSVLASEQRASFWLADHSGKYDVIATNVHCWPIAVAKPCNSRAFWVAGLTGRRVLIESWGYADQSVAKDGVNGLRYAWQPAPYPDQYELNQRVFAQGNPADVAELRDRYHVKWLLGDTRAPGGVAHRLSTSAKLMYTDGPVTVYQL